MLWSLFFFFFNDTATTEIYTLSLHDALPISIYQKHGMTPADRGTGFADWQYWQGVGRSEEHTSELQSQSNLVCRLLLEKKKNTISQALFFALAEGFDHAHFVRMLIQRIYHRV